MIEEEDLNRLRYLAEQLDYVIRARLDGAASIKFSMKKQSELVSLTIKLINSYDEAVQLPAK